MITPRECKEDISKGFSVGGKYRIGVPTASVAVLCGAP